MIEGQNTAVASRERRLRNATGFVVFLLSLLLLSLAYGHAGDPGSNDWTIIPLFSVGIGTAFGLFAVRKWDTWLTGLSAGLLVGGVAAARLFFGPLFEGEFLVGFLTVAVYGFVGFFFGGIGELIRGLHHAVHGIGEKVRERKK